jgi:hypothetical protein
MKYTQSSRSDIAGDQAMGRPKKNSDELVGRVGRVAIESEDGEREARRWQRKRETIKKFAGKK